MSRHTFTPRDERRLVQGLENQGCKIRPTSKGYWVGFPCGASTSFHLTASDVRAVKNIRAIIERNGCEWPL